MKCFKQRTILVAITLALVICGSALANESHGAGATPSNKQIVGAMDAASTWGHPDLFGEFAGMRRYAEGDYKGALKYFRIGARYADKPSQLAIGMLYANGLGVDKDIVTGCAWLSLASSRKYPKFVATQQKFCAQLTSDQNKQVDAALDKLLPEYGDKVARKRMKLALRTARSQATGSHVGFDFGMVGSADGADMGSKTGSACGSSLTIAGIPWPTKGCVGGTFWSADRWDPKVYFALRDANLGGSVTVEPLQNVKPPLGEKAQ